MDTYEPTPEEIKNGWTPETLEAYAEDRDKALNSAENDRIKFFLPTYQVRKHPFKR